EAHLFIETNGAPVGLEHTAPKEDAALPKTACGLDHVRKDRRCGPLALVRIRQTGAKAAVAPVAQVDAVACIAPPVIICKVEAKLQQPYNRTLRPCLLDDEAQFIVPCDRIAQRLRLC